MRRPARHREELPDGDPVDAVRRGWAQLGQVVEERVVQSESAFNSANPSATAVKVFDTE